MFAQSNRTSLEIKLEGPAVEHDGIALNDLLFFGGWLQTAVNRIGQVLSSRAQSAQRGRKGSAIETSCALQIRGIRKGSLRISCDLPLKAQAEMFDLGEDALECLVVGIGSLAEDGGTLPRGYDEGVLSALEKNGKLFDRGIQKISFGLRGQKRQKLTSSYTPEVHAKVVSRVREPIESKRTLEGRLLMGDFKESALRCRIHPPVGPPIACTFEEKDKDAIYSALRRHVRLIGVGKESGGRIQDFKIEKIEVLGMEAEQPREERGGAGFFGPKKDLETLAAEQGIKPVTDFSSLVCRLWPEDESVEDFIGVIESRRDEDLERESG